MLKMAIVKNVQFCYYAKYNLGKFKINPIQALCLGYLGASGWFAGALPCALIQLAFQLLPDSLSPPLPSLG